MTAPLPTPLPPKPGPESVPGAKGRGNSPPQPPSPPPPPPPEDTPRAIAVQALTFIGPLTFFAGLIAILRTGDRDWLYLAMLPIGTIMWLVGFAMGRKN